MLKLSWTEPREAKMSMSGVTQKTVVIVEDEPSIVILIQHILDTPLLQLFPCMTGEEGLTTIVNEKPDLIILDVMLPGVNGQEIFQFVRSDEELKNIPILVLSVTNKDEFERFDGYRGNKVDRFIAKPFDMANFRHTVQDLLGLQLWEIK
jgi:two-component system, OmpR family, alkaline phosphatase synthesis response regulator PhoP